MDTGHYFVKKKKTQPGAQSASNCIFRNEWPVKAFQRFQFHQNIIAIFTFDYDQLAMNDFVLFSILLPRIGQFPVVKTELEKFGHVVVI